MTFLPDGPGGIFRRAADHERTATIVFVAPGSSTNGEFGLFEARVAPGQGASPHYHTTFSESFYVLSGRLTLRAGADERAVTAGDFVHVPPTGVHAFRNEPDADADARFLILFSPGIAREGYFRELAALAARTEPASQDEIDAMARRHDQINLR